MLFTVSVVQSVTIWFETLLRSLRKEGFSQGEVDHLFSAPVFPNFSYGLPVYGAVDSDLTVKQTFWIDALKGNTDLREWTFDNF